MIERQTRDLEVQGSNPSPGSKFSLEFKLKQFFYVHGAIGCGSATNSCSGS